jgi:hypothetical protein
MIREKLLPLIDQDEKQYSNPYLEKHKIKKYTILKWIDSNKLDDGLLSLNCKDIDLLRSKTIDWDHIIGNPYAIPIIQENINKYIALMIHI